MGSTHLYLRDFTRDENYYKINSIKEAEHQVIPNNVSLDRKEESENPYSLASF